jgi:hypothetical protein
MSASAQSCTARAPAVGALERELEREADRAHHLLAGAGDRDHGCAGVRERRGAGQRAWH